MKWSKAFITTYRESPSEAELISHKLMIRSGMIKKVFSGVYIYMPLAWRVINKIENIVRAEMNAKDAIELHMPILSPADLWKKTGRWNAYGDSLWKVSDRNKNEFCLGPTHEEIITDLVRTEITSYKQLPVNLYQIQTKIRDEVRPRFGLMRAREFIMKDAYSFHANNESLNITYQEMYEAYTKIFTKCGLKFKTVEADSGAIGGSFSHEFMVLAQSGEDYIATCTSCEYAANVEKAQSIAQFDCDDNTITEQKTIDTPNVKTIAQLESFFNKKSSSFIKTILYIINNAPVAVVVRGDYEICDTKLKNIFPDSEIRLASDEEVKIHTSANIGFMGPINLKNVFIVADETITNIKNGICGANEDNKHISGISYGRDFNADKVADIKLTKSGDRCKKCNGTLELLRGIETGHIFQLGTKYSSALGAVFLDEKMQSNPCIMGCYGIGVSRIAAAAIEQNYDEDGIIWPNAIAPYSVVITNIDIKLQEASDVANKLYDELIKYGIDVILDDRDERPGVKFKDADLIGFPIRVNIGSKGLKDGVVEIKTRKTKIQERVSIDKAFYAIIDTLKLL